MGTLLLSGAEREAQRGKVTFLSPYSNQTPPFPQFPQHCSAYPQPQLQSKRASVSRLDLYALLLHPNLQCPKTPSGLSPTRLTGCADYPYHDSGDGLAALAESGIFWEDRELWAVGCGGSGKGPQTDDTAICVLRADSTTAAHLGTLGQQINSLDRLHPDKQWLRPAHPSLG